MCKWNVRVKGNRTRRVNRPLTAKVTHRLFPKRVKYYSDSKG